MATMHLHMIQNEAPSNQSMTRDFELVIVGAGPIGIACGIEARRRDVRALILEKGCITNSIFNYPTQMVFFSTPQLLEVGDIPFVTLGPKPTRAETLAYYRRAAEHYDLRIQTHEAVEEILGDRGEGGEYVVRTSKGKSYSSRYVVLATGCYDHPNLLGVPGEDLPKVSHYYRDPHPYYRQRVAVVGGQNSAAEAALDLHRCGASVTLIHRRSSLGDSVKYWVRPDIENRIKDGSIQAIFDAGVERIEEDAVLVSSPQGERLRIENDFVFLLTGYRADLRFLRKTGIVLDLETEKPLHDPATMETNLRGLYVAGVVTAGKENGKLFIENTRYHAKLILQDIQRKILVGKDEDDDEG